MELKELLGALGLKEDAKIDDVKAKVVELKKEGKIDLKDITSQLELKEDASVEEIVAKMKEKKTKEGDVTMSEKDLNTLKSDAAAGKTAAETLKAKEVDEAVTKALNEGKIVPASKDWATEYAKKDLVGFNKFMETAPKVLKTNADGSENAGGGSGQALVEIEKLAKGLMDKDKNLQYAEAVKQVYDADPELAKKYNEENGS